MVLVSALRTSSSSLGVKRREILSRLTRQFVFPRGHPHIRSYVLGGNVCVCFSSLWVDFLVIGSFLSFFFF